MLDFEIFTLTFANEFSKVVTFGKTYSLTPAIIVSSCINNSNIFVSLISTTSATIESSDSITGDVYVHVYKV